MGVNKKKADEMVNQIIQADPARGYLDAAMLAQEDNDVWGAETYHAKALASYPKDYEALVSASEFYRKTANRNDLAEKYARAAITVDPTRIGGYSALAALHALENR
jgi:hypothetical protein